MTEAKPSGEEPVERLPHDPATPEEWQEAVDWAFTALAIDSMWLYGLIQTNNNKPPFGGINVERCNEILKRGEERGVTPTNCKADEIVKYVQEHRSITRTTAADLLGIPREQASFILKQMTRIGQLKQKGKKRGSMYVLNRLPDFP